MKICLFGASSSLIDDVYINEVERLGETLARRGHSLVFGAGGTGVMGAAARGIKSAGGTVLGVIPYFFRDEAVELIFDNCDDIIYTDSMRERKKIMEDKAEAFIITPGGIGTYEEFFEVLTLKQLGRHSKPIAIYNINGYFNGLDEMLKLAIKEKFLNKECMTLYKLSSDPDELFDYIECKEHIEFNLLKLK
ncbi:MAG: TIGR00730 family Rossman fold protein [Clostridia bacterium]|nr:TIGR00730 family Rossman fold protein [Clostridia bacterium]